MTAVVDTGFVTGPDFAAFVQSYEHSAFRLEVRDRYNDAEEAPHVAAFLAGGPGDDSWMDDWTGTILRRTLAGQRMSRVRVVSEPWSDYTRFGLHISRLNVAAGEDIRYLPRDRAVELDLPDHDFWLLDGSRMCILRHDADDVLLGAEIVTDPAVILRHCYAREAALRHAIPRAEYLAAAA